MVVLGTYDRLRASKIEGRVSLDVVRLAALALAASRGDLFFLPKNRYYYSLLVAATNNNILLGKKVLHKFD
jgi:hypothetical protein